MHKNNNIKNYKGKKANGHKRQILRISFEFSTKTQDSL